MLTMRIIIGVYITQLHRDGIDVENRRRRGDLVKDVGDIGDLDCTAGIIHLVELAQAAVYPNTDGRDIGPEGARKGGSVVSEGSA